MLEHLEVLTLRAVYEAKGSGKLPAYLGSTFRGALGHAIREAVCHDLRLPCHQCDKASQCDYALTFNSPGNEGGAVNPLVLRTLSRDKTGWFLGDSCAFEVTLIGKTARLRANAVIRAMEQLGQSGLGAARIPFRLLHVSIPQHQTLVYSSGKHWVHNQVPEPLSGKPRQASALMLQTSSPLRLLIRRQLQREPDFHALIHSLLRRITLLSQAFAEQLPQWDEEQLLTAARQIHTVDSQWRSVDFERYSMTRGGKLALPAIEGWAHFSGDITPFTPLLDAGQLLHIGKNATHGFGQYELHYA